MLEPWSTPIRAASFRSNDLAGVVFTVGGLKLKLVEEESEQAWELVFNSIQAMRFTSEECAASVFEGLPHQGGFFQGASSQWLTDLGQGQLRFMASSKHFVICCYDAVIEVVGAAPQFSKLA